MPETAPLAAAGRGAVTMADAAAGTEATGALVSDSDTDAGADRAAAGAGTAESAWVEAALVGASGNDTALEGAAGAAGVEGELSEVRRRGAVDAPRPPERTGASAVSPLGSAAGSAACEEEPRTPPAERRVGVPALVEERGAEEEVEEEAEEESVAFDPVEPADPVVSANAAGIETTAEPTPNATASAPTRPTKRA